MGLRSWLAKRRRRREVERLVVRTLDEALRDPKSLAGTSLKPRHAPRCVVQGWELGEGDTVERIEFGIVRHPRPYRFSPRQHHKVLEFYALEVAKRRVVRIAGLNLTRTSGRDDD